MHPRTLLLAGLACLAPAALAAQEPIRFARTPDVSPDGKTVAFSYLGDIWTVESVGGVARPVTMHEAHEINPVFSPDGRQIAFSSNRHGSYDVFVVASVGGRPKRLTFDSASDIVCGWSPDGKNVLFTSTRSTAFPPALELFSVPVTGGAERRVGIPDSREGVYSPKGDAIAFTRGPGTWYRKGYRGSSNDDVWVAAADGSASRRLTDFTGEDTSPMWSADGQRLFYVSEVTGGPANIVVQNLSPNPSGPLAAGKPVPLTHHADDAVRKARISGNGEWIVYECGADLWIVSARGGTPRKLAIEVHADDKTNTEKLTTFTQGATEYAPSPDEKHVAFAVHGTLFLTTLPNGGKATQLTDGTAYDHGLTWAPDGKKLVFASDRSGHEELYLLEPDDPEHPELTAAHKFKLTQLTHTPDAEVGANFSPDGKRIAFLRAGKLITINPDGSDEKVVVGEPQVVDYEWSPDSKWLAYSRLDGSFASEVYLVPAAGGAGRNVTRYATYNSGITWSQTGGKLAFLSQRHGAPSMHVLSLQKPAAAGSSAPAGEIDWEDIHLRVTQPAPLPADEGDISPDGSKVAFRATVGSGGGSSSDLWVALSAGGEVSRATAGNLNPRQVRWSRKSSSTVFFLDNTGSVRVARLGGGLSSLLGGASGPSTPDRVAFTAKLTVRRDEEFREMFDQSWRALRDSFYDPKFHGADWEAVRAKYRPLVAHVGQKEDLYALISLMLGELNASHLGITGPGAVPEEFTADLGLLFDEAYKGPGLKVAEVLKRGPADRRGLALKAGDIILSLDRAEITPETDLARLLNGKSGETVVAQVLTAAGADPKDPKNRRRLELKAVGRSEVAPLMYERWVEQNAKRVEAQSKGTVGYIHIPSMDEEGLERFIRALYSDNFDKDAVVLDVRYNGGGFTHDQVLNYLGGREHTFFRQRDGGEGLVLRSFDRKWTKPVTVLINNCSYSDAEIFPSAFRAMGLGKVVGQPTGGHVIGTSSVRLIDGSSFRVPRTGVFTAAGANMEREGVQPDVPVEASADDLAKGADAQLDKAVEVVMKDVVAWKKARAGSAVRTADAGKPAAAAPPAAPPAPAPAAPSGGPGAGGRN